MHTLILRSEEIGDRACKIIRASVGREPLLEVVIRPYRSKRSIAQNSLHWKRLDAIRLHIADSTGQFFSAEELHDFFKGKFLPAKTVEVGGETVIVRRSTAKLNTKEMAEFMGSIDRYCVERLHLYLPQPGTEE